MSEQICGIILEGPSCSGKTSLFNAIQRYHLTEAGAERNVIYLAEHYSQNLNWVNGVLQGMSRAENLQVLRERVALLEQLNRYANSMGIHSRRSRGLFFVFERFHLNFAVCFRDGGSEEYVDLQQRLTQLHALTVLCTISPQNVLARLEQREASSNRIFTQNDIDAYNEKQRQFLACAQGSLLPTVIVNTDSMAWDAYTARIFRRLRA
ncbi:MAG: hypothetical protein LLG09_00885 [Negativicutes bacterium]|nr:hypothetical protein [Negativicutes bacterium]